MAYGYARINAKSVGEMIELRFKFQELRERREQEDRKTGNTGPEAANKLSTVTFRLDK